MIGLVGGIGLLFWPNGYALWAGIGLLLFVTLLRATFNEDEASRARWIFAVIFVLLLGVTAWVFEQRLQQARPPADWVVALEQRLIAVLLGGFISTIVTTALAMLTILVASVYVLSINIVEEVSIWAAFRSLLSLILNTQYDWLVVSEGKVTRTREGGVMKFLGGPGKLIIDPGNAVALQRSGKITQIVGSGVWLTQRNENIREIFDLTNQFTVQRLSNVMTADRIPLEVEVGIGFRIVRETNPDPVRLLPGTHNGFPVYTETLYKAINNNTIGGKWTGLGVGAPISLLRDQFMSYTLDELFESFQGQGDIPQPSRRMISQIEQEILTTLDGFAANNGVTFTGVDIREVKLPETLMEARMLELKSKTEARSRRLIAEEQNRAQQELIDEILATIARYKGGPLNETDLQMAVGFVQLGRRDLSNDLLEKQYSRQMKKFSEATEHDKDDLFEAPKTVTALDRKRGYEMMKIKIPLAAQLSIDQFFDQTVDRLLAVEFIYSVFALLSSHDSTTIADFFGILRSDRGTRRISNPFLHRFLIAANIEPLRLISMRYGSPASFDLLGIAKIFELLRDTLKDLAWRGQYERRKAELDLKRDQLDLEKTSAEIEAQKLENEKNMIQIADQKIDLIDKTMNLSLPDNDKQVLVKTILPWINILGENPVSSLMAGEKEYLLPGVQKSKDVTISEKL